MAQSYTSTLGTLYIPGAYGSYTVQAASGGLATSGVMAIIGEADAGPDYTLESDLATNSFAPSQVGAVLAKYKSGPLVDAFFVAAAPSNDTDITGGPQSIIFIKTNPSTRASAMLKDSAGSNYIALADKTYGKLGNLIYSSVAAATSEVVPTTGSFSWMPNAGAVSYEIRVSGGANVGGTSLSAATTPATLVSTLNALGGTPVTASGGANRNVLGGAPANTLALAVVSGNSVTITYTGTWATTPTVGDTAFIPTGSILAGTGNANVGGYVVTAATTTTISATKLTDTKVGAVPGTVTAPLAVSATSVAALSDLQIFAPVTVALPTGTVTNGVGKSLEWAEVTNGSGDLLSNNIFALSTTKVSWVSKISSAYTITSATEYSAALSNARQVDNISETITAGGEIGLKVGYKGTTATITISDSTLSTTVTGGTGASISSISLKDFKTIADVANYINAQTGYTAAAGTAVIGQLPSSALDDGTFNIASTNGAQNGRIKTDAYRFAQAVNGTSVLVQLGATATPGTATAGLPGVTSTFYLTGGARGATTDAIVSAAFTAAEKVRTNFVVPLFSRDATADITDGLTDSGSSYTIASIHAVARSHAIKMAGLKARRARQALVSIRDTFANAKNAAANIASGLVFMTFQDFKALGSDGTIKQMQPWAASVDAAAMQCAAFYKSIVHKFINCSGALQAAGDWTDTDDAAVEDALKAGLCPIARSENGGFYWVSDQTTYGRDNNFVYNSLQTTYAANLVTLGAAKRMEDRFVGQSNADVTAETALTYLEGIMADYRRLKLIVPSDDAPAGFKNASIVLTGTAMVVQAEIKPPNSIYFVPISFYFSQSTSSSST